MIVVWISMYWALFFLIIYQKHVWDTGEERVAFHVAYGIGEVVGLLLKRMEVM